MSYTVQHKRSDTSNRRPLPTELENGQVAVNYSNDTPGLYFRTSTNALAKAGPPIVSTTTPEKGNLENYQSFSVGEFWFNPSNGNFYYWAASGTWELIGVSLTGLKDITAASSSFSDFQNRIASM